MDSHNTRPCSANRKVIGHRYLSAHHSFARIRIRLPTRYLTRSHWLPFMFLTILFWRRKEDTSMVSCAVEKPQNENINVNIRTMDHSRAGQCIVAQKVFTFEQNENTRLTVSIPEVLDPQYGMYVWPCAVVLAQFVWTHRGELQQKTVLELGAGASLPGVVAAKCGAQVTLSDSAELPLCLENCRRSCAANSLPDVHVVGLTWGEISPDLVLLPALDIILGSDVFYEPEDFENVLVTIAYLLKKNPKAQFWTTYQERSADWSVEGLLHKWNLRSVDIPLEIFHANKAELAGSKLPGSHTVQMMIVTLRTDSG